MLLTDSSASWLERLRAAGVPCGPVNDMAGAVSDPQTLARDLIAETEHPVLGTVRQIRSAAARRRAADRAAAGAGARRAHARGARRAAAATRTPRSTGSPPRACSATSRSRSSRVGAAGFASAAGRLTITIPATTTAMPSVEQGAGEVAAEGLDHDRDDRREERPRVDARARPAREGDVERQEGDHLRADHDERDRPPQLGRVPVAPAQIAREEEVGEQQDAAAEELRGHDPEQVERLAAQHEVAHEQSRAAVADRADQRQDRPTTTSLAARGAAGEDDHEHPGEADGEAEHAQGGDPLVEREPAITATKNGRGVEQHGRDRGPGADGRPRPGRRVTAPCRRGPSRREPPEARGARQPRPNRRRNGSSTRKPSTPRENAVKAGVVCRSATSVTLNAAPQKIIVKSSSSGTGMRASRPLTDA